MQSKFLTLAAVAVASAAALSAASVHDFDLATIDGKPLPLSAYKGRVLLLVNTASR